MRARRIFVTASGRRVSIDLKKVALLAGALIGVLYLITFCLIFYTPWIHGFRIPGNREAAVRKLFQDTYAGISNALLAPLPRQESPLPTYRLSVDPERFSALNHDILRHAYGELERKPRVNAWRIMPDGKHVPVKVILRGTNTWHHQLWKPSLRIRHPKGQLEEGHRHHILIPPKGPTALRNWLSNELARRWGMLHVDQQHVRLFINRRYRGLYTRYFRFDESLLIQQGLLPGPFFRLEDNAGPKFNRIPASFHDPDTWEHIGIEEEAGEHAIQTLLDVMALPPGSDQFAKLNDVVDREAFAKYLALRCHGGETHIDSHNVAMWLDTSSGKFVPLFADIRGYGWYGRPMNRPVLGKNIHRRGHTNGIAALEYVWLSDPRNLALYMDRLHELMEGFGSLASTERIVREEWREIRPDAVADLYTSEKGEWSGVGTRSFWPVQRLDGDVDRVVATVEERMAFMNDALADLELAVVEEGEADFEILVHGVAGAVARRRGGREYELLPSIGGSAAAKRPYAFHRLPGAPREYTFANRLSGRRAQLSPPPAQLDKYRQYAGVHAGDLDVPDLPPVVLGPGTITLNETLDWEPGRPVTIRAGTKLLLGAGVSLRVRGLLRIEGTPERPVIMRPLDPARPFGVLAVVGQQAAGSRILGLDIEGGSIDRFLNLDLVGMVSVHDVPGIEIRDSRFGANHVGDDNLHLVRSSAVLHSNIFEGARADAVDLDQVEAKIIHCAFLDSGNDALDLSMSSVDIQDNLFARSGDKGISIGEGSRARIERCQFERNDIGVQVKDRSHADLAHNTFSGSRVAIYATMKKWRWEAGGTVTIQETTFSGSTQADVSGDRKSRITFVGRRPVGVRVTGKVPVTVEKRRADRTP